MSSQLCINCGRSYGQHYGVFCTGKDAEIYRKTGKKPAFTFELSKIKRNDPNILFKKRKNLENEI